MPQIPTAETMGRRRIGRSGYGTSGPSADAAAAPGRALERIGQQAVELGEQFVDREATAAAKERDTYAAEELRKLMYDPEQGYLNSEGKLALDRMGDFEKRAREIGEKARKGLSPYAAGKAEAALDSRVQGAIDRAYTHASAQRKQWIDSTTEARMASATLDAIEDGANTARSLAVIRTELQGKLGRGEISQAEYELTLQTKSSAIYRGQIERAAAYDPMAGWSMLQQNRGSMAADDVLTLERQLQPEVQREQGRQIGRTAYGNSGAGNAIIRVAETTLGMNENAQRGALQEYLRAGGSGVDPSTTAWCAAWLNSTLAQAGMGGTGSMMARSFLDWGDEVAGPPQPGDVIVLSRGDPPFGHVGIFQGFDENGNVQLLGGNQRDSVNVQSFDRRRILGVRRAPDAAQRGRDAARGVLDDDSLTPRQRDAALDEIRARTGLDSEQEAVDAAETGRATGAAAAVGADDPAARARARKALLQIEDEDERAAALQEFDAQTAGSEDVEAADDADAGREAGRAAAEAAGNDQYAVAREYQRIMQIDDPEQRAYALEEFNAQTAASQQIIEEGRKAAIENAGALIEGGGSVDTLPLRERNFIGREGMTALRAYERSKAAGREITTDEEFRVDLMQEAVTDTAAFAKRNPLEWRDKLSDAHYNQLLGQWQQANGAVAEQAQAAAQPLKPTVISSIMSQADGLLREFDIKKGDAGYATFQSRVVDWATANPDLANDPAARRDFIESEMIEVTIDGGFFSRARTGPAATIVNRGTLDESDDLEILPGGYLSIGGEEVDPATIETFVTDFTEHYGYAPQSQDILDYLIQQRR